MSLRTKAILGLAALGLAGLVGITSYHSTNTTEVGVRTKKWGIFGKAGVEDKVYQPGSTYFFPPILNDWDTYDTKLIIVEMKRDPKIPLDQPSDDLAFKTIEGNDIHQGIIFSYRIDPTKVSYIKQFVAPDDEQLKEKVFKTVARSRTRDYFGELNTEQFYNADARNTAAENAKKGLQEILKPYGIILEKVSLGDYRFNPAYTEVIKEKKLAEAQTLQLTAQLDAQREMNKKLLNDADGTVNEIIARINGQYTNTMAAADAYYDQQVQNAKAIVIEGENTAEAIRKQREAMASAGGETQVKMKIAENLKGKRIIMIPSAEGGVNFRTLNLNEFLEAQGLQSISGSKK